MAAVKCTFSRLWGLRREGLLHMEDIVGCKSSCGWEPREIEKIRILQPEVCPKWGILFETTVAFVNFRLWCSDFQTTEDLHLLTGWCATLKNWSPQKSLIRATSICCESSLLVFDGCLILRSFHGMLHKLRGSWRRVGLVYRDETQHLQNSHDMGDSVCEDALLTYQHSLGQSKIYLSARP